MTELTLPLPPSLNLMYRPNFGGRKGMRKTAECEAWETEVQWIARSHNVVPIPKVQRVIMTVEIFYKTERDIDSSQKSLQDCLQGYLYEDDKQIDRLVIEKHKDNANPRIVVGVVPRLSDGPGK